MPREPLKRPPSRPCRPRPSLTASSRDKAAKNQPITFTFNTADYPTATDVKWTFPGDVVKQGTVVKYGLGSVGTQTVKLSATINGNVRTWNLEVEIREYVVYSTDWAQDGSNYNGFKGSCPVFSPDGKTIYIITFNKVAGLYAFDLATGSEKWRYTRRPSRTATTCSR